MTTRSYTSAARPATGRRTPPDPGRAPKLLVSLTDPPTVRVAVAEHGDLPRAAAVARWVERMLRAMLDRGAA